MDSTARTGADAGRSTVLLVDDHQLVRDCLRLVIDDTPDLRVCGDVADAEQAQQAVAALAPAVVLVDVSLGGGSDGLALVKWLHARHAGVKSVVASMHDEAVYGERALRAGAGGYVSKSAPARTVLEAIRRVLAGELHFSRKLLDSMLRRASGADQRSPMETLSDRELQVLRSIGHGLASKEIAHALSLSVSTVDTYRERLKSKLGLANRSELVHWATRWMLEHN